MARSLASTVVPRIAALLAALLLALLAAPAHGAEPDDAGWAVFMDNDAFTLGTRDHDYTGGVAVTLAGGRARDWPLSLDPALGAINAAVGVAMGISILFG